jgi:oligoribonuclease NrnB/cAMP/cGMP phosphodiesterase (DHH superfamily)
MKQKEYLIIYHKEDNDGIFSATIIYDYIINKLGYKYKTEDLVFIGADYVMMREFAADEKNTPEQLHQDFKHIILTDISFDPKYMKALFDEFGHDFIWFDHHAPIIKESFRNKFDEVPGIRDTGRSAILCAYKYLYDPFDEAYNNKTIPELFRILSAWDSWTYEKEGYDIDFVRNVNKGTTIKYDLSISNIKQLVNDVINLKVNSNYLVEDLYDFGKKLNDYDDIVIKGIIETAGDKSWKLFTYDNDKPEHPIVRHCCAIFHQGASNSLMFKTLRNTNIKNGIVFKHNPNTTWTISLYNVNDEDWFHCGEYLKEKYKGGGHKGAAGCQVTEEQFIEILKNRRI